MGSMSSGDVGRIEGGRHWPNCGRLGPVCARLLVFLGVQTQELGQCDEVRTASSNHVSGAEDRIVDPHVVGQVGHVVAFALAVGVVLHAVE
jgi:hypothetical protein